MRKDPYGMSLPAKLRRTRSGGTYPSVCLECGRTIDLVAVNLAIVERRTYVHGCGKVLWTSTP